jgi:hypothetical protein
LNHRQTAAAALLGGLEDQHGRTRETARFRQVAGGAEQHGRMAVMAAGVHLARLGGGIGTPGLLLDRQAVHIGA